VGTQNGQELESRFDTPTLIEVWRTAPYLHDGRHESMKDLLLKEKRHGSVEGLSPQEIDDLAEFVLSL
jgi:cytochrome c peroxidase